MNAFMYRTRVALHLAVLMILLAMIRPAFAQDDRALETLRSQYDVMMANFERIKAAQGDTAAVARVRQGREAMQRLTNAQLAKVYSQINTPDLSGPAIATGYLASRAESQQRTPQKSLPFPGAIDLIPECGALGNLDATGRYALLVIKEIATSILAAATFVCTQDILGENGSLACVPLAIAADIANGVFDTAQFCAGEVTANQVDGNYKRLQHIHDDLGTNTTSIINNDNANKTAIINNDNTNTSTIISNDNSNKTAIISNDNANTSTIINNANANKDAIVGEIHNLACEIIRLLNTPDGLRASSVAACTGQPGFPYAWNSK